MNSASRIPFKTRVLYSTNTVFRYVDFFDNHDMWHFLSSIALFLSFLGLLTIDDDILYVKRKGIKVF